MRILFGIVGCILSILIIIYRFPIKCFIGQIGFAERYLGAGGTYTFLALAGVIGFILSLMYMTNSFDILFGGISLDFFNSVK